MCTQCLKTTIEQKTSVYTHLNGFSVQPIAKYKDSFLQAFPPFIRIVLFKYLQKLTAYSSKRKFISLIKRQKLHFKITGNYCVEVSLS